ncbi:MAG: prepilin-type N-terminal cleavage/methylation domain-containing protein [Candidatus Omnitrophica bacterium]|nr:prepilin-type N-terminal cleavage/methylation domain-containing protein [Candidatus Omnitrophota bacterium]
MKSRRARETRGRTGYSLVEMMITLTVFSLLTVCAAGVFDASQESLNWAYHSLTLQKELRRVLNVLTQEIRESSASSPNPIVVSANRLDFEIPSAIVGNNVTAWTTVSYTLGADTTVLRTANGLNEIIGSSINGLNFVYPVNAATAPRTLRVTVQGQRQTLKRNITESASAEVVLRN